jgi:uncharacterized protein involved in type VI secretion and phage assembly
MTHWASNLLDKVDARFYGKYRAFVQDNADQENRGRLRLQIPDVLGNDIVSGWALPCAPYGGSAGQGFFFIPEKGAGVWVEFEQGKLDFPVWVGTFWAKPGGTTEVPDPASGQSPPTSKIIKTLKHTIELADDDGSEAIIITDSTNKNKVTLDKDGVTVEDQNSNKIELASGGVTITSSAIKIGSGASEPMVLGNQLTTALKTLVNFLSTHTHTGNLGAPTSPPVPPLVPPIGDFSMATSTKHMVE